MNDLDRAQFLEKIASLDLEIGDALVDDNLAELMALAGKAALIAATAMLYQTPPPALILCVLCQEKPVAVQAADWDLCPECYNIISTPWQGMDEAWGELQTDNEPVY